MLDKTAVILAGGKNSRMNYRNKSFLEYEGLKFIERIIKEVSGYREIIIVSNNPSQYDYLGVKVVKDIIPGHGPLSGIHAGLINAQYHHSLVVACDMPFVKKDLLEYLGEIAEGYDVVVPKTGQYLQPLCAVYGKGCLPSIERFLENNTHKIIEFYPEVNVRYAEDEELTRFKGYERIFKNINTPEDYNLYCK
ncbi:MAG: molybdenum cofactor guanylyltransferase [Clostridia bacterium]|jgi:molybdopterin-guanine dinucleotide biosynthesis protein A|nr:molybdopterin-guanine dinucleotide biosynthesis protein [Clostridiales bacterium]MDK2985750.1 molybdenum cofactor guanylyltransferase [Clostridia bacterium]